MSAGQLDALSFPLHGSRLIEASAGTGKTYTLAALYVRLVLQHGGDAAFQRPLLPPEILVVTFTEAATRELRERIRERLAQAARCFAGREQAPAHDAFLNGLLADYPADEHAACADRLDAAAQWMDEAAVHTIHAFSNRMLRQHAFDSGSLFELELSQDESGLLQEAVRDYWRSCCYPLTDTAAAALATVFATPDALRKGILPLLDKAPGLPPPATDDLGRLLGDIHAQRTQRLTAMKAQWHQWAPELLALFEAAWTDKRLKRNQPSKSASVTQWLDAIAAWAKDAEAVEVAGLTGTTFERLTPDQLRSCTDAVEDIASHPALAALPELRAIESTLPAYAPPVLLHATHWVRARVERSKQEQAVIGFQDMLTRLRDALAGANGERLARIIREQYPVALIDEFQDTDPIQYETFQRLYGDQQNTGWFMIGDPKQAIYGFRGADVFTYIRARDNAAQQRYTLATNFRSAKPMVAAVNRLFGRAETWSSGAFRLAGRIPFDPVTANGRAEQLIIDGKETAGMTLWHCAGEGDDPALGAVAYVEEMAARTATAITAQLESAAAGTAGFREGDDWRPLQPADIAILVRTGREADAVRGELRRRGVRSVYLSDRDNVFASTAAADVERWLQACAEPETETFVRAALATSTLDRSWQALAELSIDEQRWEDEVQRFIEYRRLWRRRGVLPMLRRLLHDFELPAHLLANGDERTLTNLLHLAELLQAAAAEHEGEQALVRWLAEQRAGDDSGAEERILRLESDADLVRVITIHKAKGLEYPLVFLPFVCAFREVDAKTAPPFRYHDDSDRLCFSLEPDADIIKRAEAERLAEDLRLLYVATTRARHACWLGVAPLRKGNRSGNTDLDRSACGYLITGGESIAAAELEQRLRDLCADGTGMAYSRAPAATADALATVEPDQALAPARSYQGPRAERWWIASYSTLRPEHAAAPTDEPRSAGAEVIADEVDHEPAAQYDMTPGHGIHGVVRGPMAGTFLHGLLEHAARNGFAAAADGELTPLVERRARVRGWGAWSDTIDRWLNDFMRTPLPLGSTSVRLDSLTPTACRAELEFLLPAHGVDAAALDAWVSRHVLPGEPRPALAREQLNGMLKGFIDLVFALDGRYYVADYKSNWLGTNDQAYTDTIMKQTVLAKRQDVQYSLYLLALHRHLRARLGDAYDPTAHIGGAALLFLRGVHADSRGVHFQAADPDLLTGLDHLFAGRTADAA